MSNPVQSARGRLGYAAKTGDPIALEVARRDLAAEKIHSYIQRVVADAPPLSIEQRDRLASLLRGAA